MNPRLLLLLLPVATLLAQNSWDDLNRLKAGDRIEVMTRDRGALKGEFLRLAPTSITLRSKAGEESVAQPNVKRVGIRDGSRRIRNLVIGAGIGVGVGLAVGLPLNVRFNNETGPCPVCIVAPTLVLGGIGALAGLPTAYRTVYKTR